MQFSCRHFLHLVAVGALGRSATANDRLDDSGAKLRSPPMGERAFELQNPPGLADPSANGYSHLASVPPGSKLVFIAGQGGRSPGGEFARDFAEQLDRAFANLRIATEAASGDMSSIAKLTALIVSHDEARLQVFIKGVEKAFGPEMKPTCTLVIITLESETRALWQIP